MEKDINGNPVIEMGQELTCCITGKTFIAKPDGCSVNYAWLNGKTVSDEGVDIWEKDQLKDRTKPFTCYVSSDGKRITGWKGNALGTITQSSIGGGFGGKMLHVRVRDVHGKEWYGKGSGHGMAITIRATKK